MQFKDDLRVVDDGPFGPYSYSPFPSIKDIPSERREYLEKNGWRDEGDGRWSRVDSFGNKVYATEEYLSESDRRGVRGG